MRPGSGARRGAVPGPLARGFSAELRRWRGELLTWAFLPLTLLSGVSVVASLPAGLRSAPPAVVAGLGAAVGPSVVGGLLLMAAVLGALGVALADRTGVLARELLFGSAPVVFGARAFSTVISGAVFGLVGVLVVEVALLVATGQVLLPVPLAARTLAAVVGAALWGYLLGVLVRSPILVLFVVPATLMPAALLADVAPRAAELLPSQALLSAAGFTTAGHTTAAGTGVLGAWLTVLAGIVAVVLARRDRL